MYSNSLQVKPRRAGGGGVYISLMIAAAALDSARQEVDGRTVQRRLLINDLYSLTTPNSANEQN